MEDSILRSTKDGVDDTAENLFFQNKIITVREAAKLLRVSTKTIYKKVARDEIPYKKIGSKIRFLLPVLMDWMKG